MRVLMVAPHPVYSPRGTPISVLNRCRALSKLGHEVDLVTYPIGEDVAVPGLRYLRAPSLGLKRVRVGISWRKAPLDASVLVKAAWMLLAHPRRYAVLHTHEEAGVLGPLARALHVAHVYDMGNEFSVVARNYGFSERNVLTRAASLSEKLIVRSATVVIAHFPAIMTAVKSWAPTLPVEVVFNIPLEPPPCSELVARFRSSWSPDNRTVALYTGTLERYQGLDRLVDAMANEAVRESRLRLVIVGGTDDQVRALRERAQRLGLEATVLLTGVIPQDEVSSALEAADILVSPRASGTNTPLKLFAYLKSGKPLLATRIPSHTQILDDSSALLVEATTSGLAEGLLLLQSDQALRARLAAKSVELASAYGESSFLRGVERAYGHIPGSGRGERVASHEPGEGRGPRVGVDSAAGSWGEM